MRLLLACLAASAACSNPIVGFRPIRDGCTAQYGCIEMFGINGNTGAMTALPKSSPGAENEAQCQGLSAIDRKNGIVYIVGYNQSVAAPNLIGFDLTTGAVTVDLPLPFTELPFVGLGQAIDVVPATGDIIVTGQEAALDLHHVTYRVDFSTKKLAKVATLSGEATHTMLLGCQASTLDGQEMVQYVSLPVNNTKTNRIEVHLYRIDLKNGAVTHSPMDASKGQMLTSLDFDSKSGKLVGFGPSEEAARMLAATGRSNGFTSLAEMRQFFATGTIGRRSAAYDASYVHTLARMDPLSHEVTVLGKFTGYGMQEANIAAFDPSSRMHFSMMQKAQPPPPAWVNATGCGDCGDAAHCCADPQAAGEGGGACYKVDSCNAIHDGSGINTTAPFHLVQMNLDTGRIGDSPPLCSMAENNCPWSLDVGNRS